MVSPGMGVERFVPGNQDNEKDRKRPVLMRRLFFLANQCLDTFTATFEVSLAAAAFLHFVDLLTHDNSLKN